MARRRSQRSLKRQPSGLATYLSHVALAKLSTNTKLEPFDEAFTTATAVS